MDWLPMDRRAEITHEQLDKILDIFLVRVNLRARFPRGPRHCLSELTARLAALVLADTAQHGIRRSGRTRHCAARLAGSHRPDPPEIADHEPIS